MLHSVLHFLGRWRASKNDLQTGADRIYFSVMAEEKMENKLHLSKLEEETVKLFSNRIKNIFPESVEAVYLFGSKARGDFSSESDIDLLVVTKKNDWRLADEIRKIGYELDAEIDYKFSIIVIPEERFSFMKENRYSFAENVLNEGAVLYEGSV